MEREVGGGIGMGNTCKPLAVSFQCMTKSTTNKKKKKKKKKKRTHLPINAGDARDVGLIPGSGRYPGVGNVNPLHYSCLENAMDRGAW